MKKLMRNLAVVFLAVTLAAPEALAQRHDRGAGENNRTERRIANARKSSRREGSARHNGASDKNKKDNAVNRPGRRPEPGNRPPQTGNRPGNNVRPGRPNRPEPGTRTPHHTNRPAPPARPRPPRPAPSMRPPRPPRPAIMHRPMRPGRPIMRPWVRPVRPATWRSHVNLFYGIPMFGLRFGMSVTPSIDLLYSNGYSIDGYDTNTVYLRNVNEFGYMWPDATLYYGPSGLVRTQLLYPTAVYDLSRYNAIYSDLYDAYGAPMRVSLPGGGIRSTWWGDGNSYIQLEYSSMDTYGNKAGFFTTLTFGN